MPRVAVNEIDQSRYVAPGNDAPVIVLVPGTASFGPVFSDANAKVDTFNGTNDLSAFYNKYGLMPATITDSSVVKTLTGDISFEYATNLLNKGATVKFLRLNEGVAAEKTISGTGSTAVKIAAKYTGKMGNYFVIHCQKMSFKAPDGTTKVDAVISVYRKTTANTSTTTVSKLDLYKFISLESYRVSSDVNSQYYENLNSFEYITVNTAIVNAITSATDAEAVYALSGGLDFASAGSEITASAAIADIEEKLAGDSENDKASIFESFVDQYLFDFDFVTCGGFVGSEWDTSDVEAIHQKMITLCETRGDAVALIDTPAGETYSDVSTYSSRINTSFAAIYAPWCTVASASTGKTVNMAPSFVFLAAVLDGMTDEVDKQLWYVPAGVSRASASFVINPEYEIGSVILNEFQNNNGHRVNPIMRVRNYGYCVYGNSTCLQSVPGVSMSALESMNVRLISNVIKKAIFAVCSSLAFEYNDNRLWTKFYAEMDKVLIYMKRNFGLYDYRILMDATTVTTKAMNERRVPGKITISPTLAGEYFDIDFEIAPSGVTFNEEE